MPKYLPTPTLTSPRKISRRGLLKLGLTTAVAAYSKASRSQPGSPATIRLWTPRQTEGPFYPVREQPDKDWDLTQIEGRAQQAKGEIIHVQGRVLDTRGAAIADASVEIWQANTWGRYHHPRDTNNVPDDPDFQGWGQIRSGDKGQYAFKTILPGSYPAAPGWTRPPHIHFKVAKAGFAALTTQMYFPGEKLNADDLILQNLPAAQQPLLIAKRQGNTNNSEPVFVFNIVLQQRA